LLLQRREGIRVSPLLAIVRSPAIDAALINHDFDMRHRLLEDDSSNDALDPLLDADAGSALVGNNNTTPRYEQRMTTR
jgi:hypothetical protein